MSSPQIIEKNITSGNRRIIQLENGERADQRTFHAWYKTTPEKFKAELVGGEVIVASPLKVNHSEFHAQIMLWLGHYAAETPGTRPRDNATAILGEESEPQPDAALIIEPACGGQSSIDEEGYAIWAPELVVEIANSSGSIDLHRKKQDYERAGVREYGVILLRNEEVRWFVLRDGIFHDVPSDADSVYRSQAFPGLWLDAAAFLRLDSAGVLTALRLGLASAGHATFAAELAGRRSRK